MSTIHFVGGEKGGVGKSVFARVLCQWFVDRKRKLSALDADIRKNALCRSYAEFAHPVDLASFESADQIMDRALGAERDVVVDLPANSLKDLLHWAKEGDVFNLATETGVTLVFWLVTDGSFPSIQILEETVPALDPSVVVHVVRNQCWSRDFAQLEASPVLSNILERGGRTIELPALDPATMYRLDERSEGFAASPTGPQSDEGALSMMQQQRVARFIRIAHAQLEPCLVEHVGDGANTQAAPDSQTRESPDSEQSAPLELAGKLGTNERVEPMPTVAASAPRPRGTTWSNGPGTWIEVGEDCLIHHVRYR